MQTFSKLKYSLFAVLACLLWGSTYPAAKLTYDALQIDSLDVFSLILLTGIKFILSGIIVLCFKSVKEKKITLPDKNKFICVFLLCLLIPVLHDSFNTVGLANTTGSKAAMLKQVGFLILPAIIFMFRKDDKFSVKKLMGGVLGFASVIVMNLSGLSLDFALGDFFILAASFCAAFSTIVSKSVYEKYSVVDVVGYTQLFGGLIMVLMGALLGGRINNWSTFSVLLILYSGTALAVAYVLWGRALANCNISKMSVLKFIEPLSAVVFSGLVLGENILNPTFILAIILVFFGIYFAR